MTELWFRNPVPYARELKAVASSYNIVWDIAYLSHHNMDPFVYMSMNFGLKGNWKFMVMYCYERVAKVFNNLNQLTGEYPIWDAEEDDPEELLRLADLNEMIVICGINSRDRKDQLFDVNEVVKAYSHVKFHLYNTYSFYGLFGLDFASGDFAPRERAGVGEICLPSGRIFNMRTSPQVEECKLWVEMLGFRLPKLKEDLKERIRYNIVSAYWAAEHFKKLPSFSGKISYVPISDSVGREVLKINTPLAKTGLAIQEGDKKACDFCSLWSNCRFYREGSVCMVPGSDYEEISRMLNTRDSLQIASGVSKLLTVNVERIQEAREAEKRNNEVMRKRLEEAEADPETKGKKGLASPIDPELTKLIDTTIKQGVAIANLYAKPTDKQKVTIVMTGGSSDGLPSASPKITREVAAMAMKEIEASGTPREEITRELVEEWIRERTVEGEAVPDGD